MQVRHGFAPVGPVVKHQPVTGCCQTQLFGDLRRFQQEVAERLLILGAGLGNSREDLLERLDMGGASGLMSRKAITVSSS